MSDIHIIFKNYKLLKEGEINLKEGSIFFVQGQNNKGKTSMLNLLSSISDKPLIPKTFIKSAIECVSRVAVSNFISSRLA